MQTCNTTQRFGLTTCNLPRICRRGGVLLCSALSPSGCSPLPGARPAQRSPGLAHRSPAPPAAPRPARAAPARRRAAGLFWTALRPLLLAESLRLSHPRAPHPRSTLPAVLAAGTAEITSSDIRGGVNFDNFKATFGQTISVGELTAQLDAEYDYRANKDFFSSATLAGDIIDGDDLRLSYEVGHDFDESNTNVKLSAAAMGTTLGAE